MTEDQSEQDVINYRIGLLVLKEQAVFNLALTAEELRKVRIRRQAAPIPNANPFLEVETSYMQDCIIDTVRKELELLYPKIWLEATEESKTMIYNKVTDFVMNEVNNSLEPLEVTISILIINEVDQIANQVFNIKG